METKWGPPVILCNKSPRPNSKYSWQVRGCNVNYYELEGRKNELLSRDIDHYMDLFLHSLLASGQEVVPVSLERTAGDEILHSQVAKR